MPKFELKKTIEAAKLNKRTGIPLGGPPVTISFGAIIEDIEEDRDYGKFLHLGQPYRCALDVLMAALDKRPLPEGPAAAPARALDEAAEPGPRMVWRPVASPHHAVARAKVPGGWMVLVDEAALFYPDPEHQWDGTTLP
jgi:hypothetical protein